MVAINFILLIQISKGITSTSDTPSIKTLPVFLRYKITEARDEEKKKREYLKENRTKNNGKTR